MSGQNRRCHNDKLDYFEWQAEYNFVFINLLNKKIDICMHYKLICRVNKWQTCKQMPGQNRICRNDRLYYFEWQAEYKFIFINLPIRNIDICMHYILICIVNKWQAWEQMPSQNRRCHNDKLDYFE